MGIILAAMQASVHVRVESVIQDLATIALLGLSYKGMGRKTGANSQDKCPPAQDSSPFSILCSVLATQTPPYPYS